MKTTSQFMNMDGGTGERRSLQHETRQAKTKSMKTNEKTQKSQINKAPTS